MALLIECSGVVGIGVGVDPADDATARARHPRHTVVLPDRATRCPGRADTTAMGEHVLRQVPIRSRPPGPVATRVDDLCVSPKSTCPGNDTSRSRVGLTAGQARGGHQLILAVHLPGTGQPHRPAPARQWCRSAADASRERHQRGSVCWQVRPRTGTTESSLFVSIPGHWRAHQLPCSAGHGPAVRNVDGAWMATHAAGRPARRHYATYQVRCGRRLP